MALIRTWSRTKKWWLAWSVCTALLAAVLALGIDFQVRPGHSVIAKVRSLFAPAAMSHGHAQIGMQCTACHGDKPMAGRDAMQEKCVACHTRNDSNKVENTHPRAKFEDPANADRLSKLDALHCTTCHSEHRPGATSPIGVTQPVDFCVACHEEVAKDTPSHAGIAFDTCASVGCHSFHDNRSTYRKLLKRNIDKPEPPGVRTVPLRDFAVRAKELGVTDNPHGKGQVGECKTCHAPESKLFGEGKHGMRIASSLEPMRPELSTTLPFKPDAHGKDLNCTTCHEADQPNVKKAAVEACVSCHDDSHTQAYAASRHAQTWRDELSGKAAPGTGVSCATCHMPRQKAEAENGMRRIVVNHANSTNLRPVIKQARVCVACHSLQFTHDSLADKALIQRNFLGRPTTHVRSIDMERARP